MSITHLTAVQLKEKIQSKELSPVEVMEAFLNRIESEDKKWNSFVTLNDKALEEAKKAEEHIMKGQPAGKIHGLPVAIKDLTPTKGIRTTYGSLLFENNIPTEDPTFIKRIKAEGGIILGKTNTPEFGFKGTTDNPLFGVTKNPWDERLTPGGSSGGAAAAVAAKLAPFAEGSDGGGSIRIPASLTGIFGFKPTYGRIPHDGDPNNLFGSQHPYLHHGPMSRTVADSALLYSVMQGNNPNDPFSLPDTGEDIMDLSLDMSNVKIGYTKDFGMYEVANDVAEVIDQAAENLKQLGCQVEPLDITFPIDLDRILNLFFKLWAPKYASSYAEIHEKQRDMFSDDLGKVISYGKRLTALEYKNLEIDRTKVWTEIQKALNTYDLIISPTIACTAFEHHLPGPDKINDKEINPQREWLMTQLYNLTGHPVASLPVGLTKSNLPVGLQVAGNRFADQLVLQVCHQYEQQFTTFIDPETNVK